MTPELGTVFRTMALALAKAALEPLKRAQCRLPISLSDHGGPYEEARADHPPDTRHWRVHPGELAGPVRQARGRPQGHSDGADRGSGRRQARAARLRSELAPRLHRD